LYGIFCSNKRSLVEQKRLLAKTNLTVLKFLNRIANIYETLHDQVVFKLKLCPYCELLRTLAVFLSPKPE